VEQDGHLTTAFRAAAGAGVASPDEDELASACARARAANPGLLVDDDRFAAHVGRAMAHGEADGASLGSLAIEDLYLACACLARAPGAAAELRKRHRTTICAAVARIVPGSEIAEIEQQLLDELLVGSVDAAPKIGSYAGQAPLGRWLQVAAQRRALMWIRSNRAEARARKATAAQRQQLARDVHPEMEYLKERYRADFEQALEQALQRASERDRALLRLHLVSGLTVEKIGKMFGVTQPTASRWLTQARSALLDDIKATLGKRLGASSRELASLAALVASRIDLSLSQLLKTR
jgi:RNA polymerase sigma-70 factor (ECF subfamily)